MRYHNTPDTDDIDEARTDVADKLAGRTDPDRDWAIPSIRTIKTALTGSETPIALTTSDGESVLLEHFDITKGRPKHGAMMSGSHISGIEATIPHQCGACGNRRAVLDYSRYHNIAGGYSLVCEQCEDVLDSDEWG